MEYVRFGRTGLRVSNIALGTWQLGGQWGDFDADVAITAIRQARDDGINLFDTAQAYGFGASEEILGRALGDELRRDRDGIVLATKGGLRLVGDGVVRDSSPEWLRSGVEQSLRHLGVEVIDCYQVHWPDPEVPYEETAGALGELVEEGLIRHVGVSNYDVPQMEAFATTLPVETLQPPYHMFRRGIEEEILPYTGREDIGVMVYGPLAHGLLTGTLDEGRSFPPGDWRGRSQAFRGDTYRRNLEVVDRLGQVASGLGCSLSQLAIGWVLARPEVDVAIVGSRRAAHVTEAVEASELRLPDDVLARIEGILGDAVPIGGATPESD